MDALAAGLAAGQEQPLDNSEDSAVAETSSGGRDAVEWVSVATAVGTPNATIIAGRLESNHIPTRVTQEAAGVHALAVNVGMLGVAHVWVPAEYEEQSLDILAQEWDEEEEE